MFRALAQARPHRIEFDIADRRNQVGFVQDARVKSLLPKVAPPPLALIDVPAVRPVRRSKQPRKAVRLIRNGNNMDMIRHQAICPDLHARVSLGTRQQCDVAPVVTILEKRGLTASTALRYVMRVVRNNEPRHTRHWIHPRDRLATIVG